MYIVAKEKMHYNKVEISTTKKKNFLIRSFSFKVKPNNNFKKFSSII